MIAVSVLRLRTETKLDGGGNSLQLTTLLFIKYIFPDNWENTGKFSNILTDNYHYLARKPYQALNFIGI